MVQFDKNKDKIMHPAPNFTPEYITDNIGKKKAVILSIEQYEELMDDSAD
jgi:PHD/YefM family antitoxin component YafN of YafNO toxin-antitoxin module